MLGAVHASIGAAVGSFFKKKSAAFLAGVVSHAIADAVPHNDLSPAAEVPLLAATIVGIAAYHGVDSPVFWGALGGVMPDVEHGLALTGVLKPEKRIFPTHIADGKWHGRESSERWSQLIITGLSLAVTLRDRVNGNCECCSASKKLSTGEG